MKISDVIIDMHQGINTVADKVEYLEDGIPIIQSKNFTKGYLDLEDVRYLGENDEKKYVDKYNPHVGDILMANIGTIGKSYVISEEQRFLIAWNAFLIKPNAEKVKSEFLKFYFDYLASTHYFDGLLTGGTVKFINKKKIGDITIPDKSLAEQTDICGVLSKVESVIIRRHQELKLLDDLIKARFVELFGTLHDNENGFSVVTIEDVCSLIKDGTHQTPQYTEDREEGFKFLSSKDVMSQKIDWTDIKYIPAELHEKLYATIKPQRNDILMSKNGVNYGIAAVNDTDEVFDIYVSLALLRPKEIIDPVFFRCVINNPETKRQFDSSIKGIGVPNLHLGEIKKTKIFLPPMELQKEFVAFVEQVDKSKFAVKKALDETQVLFDSLMQQYFG